MLEDRSYMRSDPIRPRLSMTALLMIANVAVFALQQVNAAYFHFSVEDYLALSRRGLLHGYLWEVITFQFLHGGFWHLFFNMICIYFFGRFAEERLGASSLLKLYLLSGVAGGLLQTFFGFVLPRYFGGSVVGASAGVYGLIAAFSLIEPNAVIRVWFILPIRAIYFMYIAGGISLFYILVPAEPGIAHAAHLGGLLAGAAFVRWDDIRDRFFPARPHRSTVRPRELIRVHASKRSPWNSHKGEAPENLSPTEFISREVDPILEKISAHGIQSLTDKEKKILEAAYSKLRKR